MYNVVNFEGHNTMHLMASLIVCYGTSWSTYGNDKDVITIMLKFNAIDKMFDGVGLL
jgi:hypothetical protein